MRQGDLEAKERADIAIWKNAPGESPESDSVLNIINKITDAPALLECQQPFDAVFRNSRSILELGAGQGWASCLLQRYYPSARFFVSDISEHAIASLPKWEHVFKVKLAGSFPSRSYEIPAADSSYDCVFTYAAAHHFAAHRRSLKEIHRVLKPGGDAFYFHEPSCRPWIYKAAYRRVNRLRPEVVEDVLLYPKILDLARNAGFRARFLFNPTLHKRGPAEFAYYFLLSKFPMLQRIFPCTGTYHFKKA